MQNSLRFENGYVCAEEIILLKKIKYLFTRKNGKHKV